MSQSHGARWLQAVLLTAAFVMTLFGISVATSGRASAQPGPFSTLIPSEATFTPPVVEQFVVEPQFQIGDGRSMPSTSSFEVTAKGAAYAAAGTFAVAGSAATYLLSRRSGGGGSMVGPVSAPRIFSFNGRFRPIRWLAPLGGGMIFFALAFAGCTDLRSHPCLTSIGGEVIVVTCDVRGGDVPRWAEDLDQLNLDCYDSGREGADLFRVEQGSPTPDPFVLIPTAPEGYLVDYLKELQGYDESQLQSELARLEGNISLSESARDFLLDPESGILEGMSSEDRVDRVSDICSDLVQARNQANVVLGVMKGQGIQPVPIG